MPFHTKRILFVVSLLAISLMLPADAATFIAGDVNSDAEVNALDVQLVINGALGLTTAYSTDIDYDSARMTNAVDVQLAINAALSLVIDSDGDGLCDAAEENLGTDLDVLDSDGDGLGDGQEVAGGTDPNLSDLTAGVEGTQFLSGFVPLEMVRVPNGSFMMGRYLGESGSFNKEDPQHQVTLTHSFWMAKYPVTKAQWEAVMGSAAPPWQGYGDVLDAPDSPAVCIQWGDAQAFITALNTATGKTFRLPTEAEWEYACRAGTTTRFYWGDDLSLSLVNDYAWWHGNAADVDEDYAHVVGLKLPNAWGLFDMCGNVWEWCQDWYGAYVGGPATDPTGPTDGSQRIVRGSGWFNPYYQTLRSAFHDGQVPDGIFTDYGFRICTTSTL